MTTDELLAKGYVRQPDGSFSRTTQAANQWANPDRGSLQAAIVEQASGHAPHGPVSGAKEGPSRFRVSIVSFRRRLIDPDNLSIKALLDCVRRAGIIPDDSAKYIELSVRQERSRDERTEITIEPI